MAKPRHIRRRSLNVRLTFLEYRCLKRAAEAAGVDVSTWIRGLAWQHAKKLGVEVPS
jgi:uncharacterized protein (DUF1778 family)